MNSRRFVIVRSELVVRLKIKCSKCGAEGLSETIKLDMSDCDPTYYATKLNTMRIGTNFPVGWSSHYAAKGEDHRCPACN